MADNRLDEAIDIVARHVIAFADVERESYEHIGLGDWKAVLKRTNELAPMPDPDAFAAAYGYLTERAER